MFRHSLSALALAVMTSTAAFAAVDKVAGVEVTADLTAIQNEKAAAYWSNIAKDLQDAIVARVVDRIADDGATIRVDLREVELASSFERALDVSDAVLVGQVNVSDPTDNSNMAAYELSVTLGTSGMKSADGSVVTYETLDTPEAYQALVGAFADQVVQRLE